jgi:hypothetical protein
VEGVERQPTVTVTVRVRCVLEASMSRIVFACALCLLIESSSSHEDRARREITFAHAPEGSVSDNLREPELGDPIEMVPWDVPTGLSESEAIARCQRLGWCVLNTAADDGGFRPAGVAKDRSLGQLCLAFLHLRSTLPQVYSSASCEPPARKAAIASLRALALKPDYAEAYITLAEAYMISRRWEDAAVAARNAAALRPNWSSPQCHLALAYLELGRYADSLGALDEEQRIRASNRLQEDTQFDGVVFSHRDEDDSGRRALAENVFPER